LRVVETGFGPAGREQWDDAGNLLVLAPGLVVTHERNVATLARLERCGIESISVPAVSCAAREADRAACAVR
jgi:arginine deiminase